MILQIPIPDAPNNEFDRAIKTRLEAHYPVKLPVYSYQQLKDTNPSRYSGFLVRCSNGNAGAGCLAFCDGFKWRIIEIGVEISL